MLTMFAAKLIVNEIMPWSLKTYRRRNAIALYEEFRFKNN